MSDEGPAVYAYLRELSRSAHYRGPDATETPCANLRDVVRDYLRSLDSAEADAAGDRARQGRIYQEAILHALGSRGPSILAAFKDQLRERCYRPVRRPTRRNEGEV